MMRLEHLRVVSALAVAGALTWGGFTAHASDPQQDNQGQDDQGGKRPRTVFVIAMVPIHVERVW